jgi:hypothetical protein
MSTEATLDITEWHEWMQYKYAEREAREHRLWRWASEFAVISILALLVYLRYAAR